MNMILKKQMVRRRGRAGFTLVEVIVVLVILAILAAIAIPALTGYIDKAKIKDIQMMVRTQVQGMQTMVIEQTQKDGGFKKEYNQPGDYFYSIQLNITGGGIVLNKFSYINNIHVGLLEYEKLTGDTRSFANSDQSFYVSFDRSGAIKEYYYYDRSYFDGSAELRVYYIPDINSTDPITTYYLTESKGLAPFVASLTSGYNIFKVKLQSDNATVDSFEKLN
ncbi:MAG: prepilin-type N-terminal cleavage/methylation domain-containing protein [Clostridiales Family XIII bacterium]|jgi:prepilin-type N-terminal cleavage/methylation domain-containing protein|nr:prepilin-type N-terminal cleavage/methylation domain-containing protein [Clostridiales Family XIII bacterium]